MLRVRSELIPTGRMRGARAYAVPREAAAPPIDLWLDANEGAPPPADLLRVVAKSGIDLMRRYPNARAFEKELAEHYGVTPDQVIVTAGIDDALYRSCVAMLEPGRNIVLTTPTFEMIARYARLAGGEVRETPWWNGAFPTNALIQRVNDSTRLVAFVSPNNPTGGAGTLGDLQHLSNACPQALVLADFAYAEFADEDLTAPALRLPNVLVLRTFSKAWGLAGLRVGYAIGPAPVVAWLRAAGNPYAAAAPSLALAAGAFSSSAPYVCQSVARVKQERANLFTQLARIGAQPLASQANFVTARFANALAVWRALAQRGIAVRAFPGRGELEHYVRITCPAAEGAFGRLSNALAEVVRISGSLS